MSQRSNGSSLSVEVTASKSLNYTSPTRYVGGYGEVWKCEWREHTVAVKKLLKHWISGESNSKFHEEIEFLQTIRHPNIVLFYGAGELQVIQIKETLSISNSHSNRRHKHRF